MKKYAERVCGGIPAVKRMFVDELRRKRLAKNLSPEEVDRLVGLGPEWSTVREMEENPDLFSFRFHQEVAWLIMNNPAAAEKLFELSGEGMNIPISRFLENRANMDEAIADFKQNVVSVRGTFYGPDPEEYIRKTIEGEATKQFEPNRISSLGYASIHIYHCIMYELAELDPKPIT